MTGDDVHLEEAAEATPISGVFAHCTVTAGSASDAFFRRDALHCEMEGPKTLPLDLHLLANIVGGGSFEVEDGKPGDFTFAFDKYPLTVQLNASIRSAASGTTVQGLEHPDLEQTITFTAPTTDPIVMRLPYDVWPVTVSSTKQATFTSDARPIPIAPWTLGHHETTANLARVGDLIDASGSKTFYFAVEPGRKTIDVHYHLDGADGAAVIDGPGNYALGATGLSRAGSALPPPTPVSTVPTSSFGDSPAETYIACHGGEDTIDGQRVFCTPRIVEGVTYQLIAIDMFEPGKQSIHDPKVSLSNLPLEPVQVGLCTVKPCTLEATIYITNIADTQPVYIGTTTMTLEGTTADAPAKSRLPFDLWTVHVDSRGKPVAVISVESGGAFDPAWKAVQGSNTMLSGASFDNVASLVFAAPVGATSINGTLQALDPATSGIVKTSFALVRNGNYQIDDAFNLIATP